jgi:hypothetical protein
MVPGDDVASGESLASGVWSQGLSTRSLDPGVLIFNPYRMLAVLKLIQSIIKMLHSAEGSRGRA